MKWILCFLALSSCVEPTTLERAAPDPRAPWIAHEARCRVGNAFVLPDVGQRRCDAFTCPTGWSVGGSVVWDRRERVDFQCRKSSPVPQNGAR